MTIGAGGGFKFGGAPATTQASGFSFGSPATTSVGGFTFKQAPVIVKPKQVEVEEKKEEAVKPSPFSGFSFGSPASQASTGSSALTSALTGGAKAEIVSSTLAAASEPLMFGSKPAQGFDSVAAAG